MLGEDIVMDILVVFLATLLYEPLVTGQATDPDLSILLCNWNPSSVLHLSQSNYYPWDAAMITSTLPRPVAIDFDPIEAQIYWTDVRLRQIGKMNVNGKKRRTLVRLSRSATPDGIAIDIGTRQLFYTDTGNDVIATVDLNGRTPKIVIDRESGLEEPRAIVLDTREKRIIWTDWGLAPYIAKAKYDGTDIREIVSTGLGWPNGLALDKHSDTLYWCDAKTDKIESVTLEGRNRKLILSEPKAHYFDIFFLHQTLYFTDLKRRAVLSIPASGGNVTVINSTLITRPAGLHVISTKVSACVPGTYGLYCQFNCGQCKGGVCNNATGTCPYGCLQGWVGDDCKSECPPNTFGHCLSCGHCDNGAPCDKSSGSCPNGCKIGWKGDRCNQLCSSNTYGKLCATCGHCAKGAKCDEVTGHCPHVCEDGWTGPLCKTKHVDHKATIAWAVGGSAAVCLVIVIVIIAVAVVLIRKKRTHQRQDSPDTNYEVSRQQRIFNLPVTLPPAYTPSPNMMIGCRYNSSTDQARLVRPQTSDGNVFFRPESEVLEDEKRSPP